MCLCFIDKLIHTTSISLKVGGVQMKINHIQKLNLLTFISIIQSFKCSYPEAKPSITKLDTDKAVSHYMVVDVQLRNIEQHFLKQQQLSLNPKQAGVGYMNFLKSLLTQKHIFLLVRHLYMQHISRDNPSSEREVGFRPTDPISIIRLGSKPTGISELSYYIHLMAFSN